MIILSVENISYSVFNSAREELKILNNISFDLEEGHVLGISGESGSGKTTLAKIIAGHLSPTSGEVKFNLIPLNNSNPVQMLFQNTGNIVNPLRRINEMVSEAALIRWKDVKKAVAETESLFNFLDLKSELWSKRGYELSGGEQQRAALARILAVKPQLLILDEPFAAQDVKSQLNILTLLKKVKEEFNLSIICISHNFKILGHFAGSVITIKNGMIYNNQSAGVMK